MRPSRVLYDWWVTLAFAAMVFLSTGVRFAVGPVRCLLRLRPVTSDP